MSYKVGDKVRIVSKWVDGCYQNWDGKMDKWLGKVMTIREVIGNDYRMKEDRGEHFGEGWYWNDKCIAGLASEKHSHPKIVITKDGAETIARLYESGKCTKTATAKCSPDDTYDFAVGSKLAFDRLMELTEADKPRYKFNVGDRVKHGDFGEGTVICISDNPLCRYGVEFDKRDSLHHNCEGLCGNIRIVEGKPGTKESSYWCVEFELELIASPVEAEKFRPHLAVSVSFFGITLAEDENYGFIGEPTNYKDAVGRPLFIGDTVELYAEGKFINEVAIVRTDADGAFVMGCCADCDEDEGTIGNGFSIIKKRSYEDVPDGETVDHITYRKTEG